MPSAARARALCKIWARPAAGFGTARRRACVAGRLRLPQGRPRGTAANQPGGAPRLWVARPAGLCSAVRQRSVACCTHQTRWPGLAHSARPPGAPSCLHPVQVAGLPRAAAAPWNLLSAALQSPPAPRRPRSSPDLGLGQGRGPRGGGCGRGRGSAAGGGWGARQAPPRRRARLACASRPRSSGRPPPAQPSCPLPRCTGRPWEPVARCAPPLEQRGPPAGPSSRRSRGAQVPALRRGHAERRAARPPPPTQAPPPNSKPS